MTTSFATTSPHIAALDAVIERAEALEVEARRLEAARLQVFADAFDLAMREQAHLRAAGQGGQAAELPYRVVRSELAVALRLSEATVERKLGHARALSHDYPLVFVSLRDGHISERHSTIIVEAGEIIGVDSGPECDSQVRLQRAAYEVAVLEVASGTSPNRLAPVARRFAQQYAEVSIDERHERARQDRRVYVVDGCDGMADLVAHLPAEEAYGILNRLTGMSKRLAQVEAQHPTLPAEDASPSKHATGRRTRDELRADLLADLLMQAGPLQEANGAHLGLGRLQAQVQVLIPDYSLLESRLRASGAGARATSSAPATGSAATTPASATGSLLGRHAPCELVGYGPISSATAVNLAAGPASSSGSSAGADHPSSNTDTSSGIDTASGATPPAPAWLLTKFDPVTEKLLSVDRYRPSEEIRRRLRLRDEHCRFPGCRVPVHRCDLDHTVDAARGGPTSTTNLAHLCRGHHTLKHHGGWRVEQLDDGELRWKSPTGRDYYEPPPSKVRFASTTSPPVPF